MWVQLFLWIATTLLTDYFREALPNVTPSGLGDFTIPTATEGRFVPLAFGTAIIQGPNVTWYGDFEAVERTVTTGLIFRREETIGFRYFLGMQMGLIRGQTAGIKRIWVGDDVVWDYLVDNGGLISDVCDIDIDDLFGGTDGGGGWVGRVRLFDGSPSQGQSDYLKFSRRKLSDSPNTSPQFETTLRQTNLPNYRGFSYVTLSNLEEAQVINVFGGTMVTTPAEIKGVNIGESNQMRHMKFEIQTFDTVANGGLGDVLGLGNDHHFIGEDLNPISLAYQVFTDTDWGRGFSESDMNLQNFRDAAEILWTEGLGFSLVIDQVQKASDLIDTIEQHIDGYIGPNPITGEIEVILARQDYVAASEFQANETNIKAITKYSRGEYNQTYNEVRVQYTDRDKDYKDNYAPAQDLANLIIQGRPRSKTMRYAGVNTATVANKIVWRDIKGLAVALASATVEMDRTAWNLQPGKVVVVTDAEVQITDVPFRIIQIRHGDPTRATILLDIVEDVFGNEVVAYTDPPPTEFVPPTTQSFALTTAQQMAMEAPYIINVNDVLQPDRFPRLYVAARTLDNVLRFEVNVDQTVASSPTGFDVFEPDLPGVPVIVGALAETLTAWQDGNGTFTINVSRLNGDLGEVVGEQAPGGIGALTGVCVISPGTATEEWLITDQIDWLNESPAVGSIQLTNVYRTGLDSAMHAHSIGAEVWFIWTGSAGILLNEQWALSNTLDVKLLSITQTDRVNLTDSPEPPSALPVVIDADARYNKPLLPFELNFTNYGNFPATSESPENYIDFDIPYTRDVPIASPNEQFQGAQVIPSPRLFRNGNVIWQVTGLDDANGTFDASEMVDDKMRISWWIYDLDATPSATRGVDEFDTAEDVPWLTPQQEISLLKSQVPTAGRVNNVFNARLEIEVSHSPFDVQPTSPEAYVYSREIMYFDFVVTALFVIPAEAVMFYTRFAGDDLASDCFDIGFHGTDQAGAPIGASQIQTAQSVFGGTSGLIPNEPEGFATALNAAGWNFPAPINDSPETLFDWNDNWTIEFRVRVDQELATVDKTFFGQSGHNTIFGPDENFNRLSLYFDESAGDLNLRFRRDNDTTVTVNANVGNPWTPSEDTWYAIAFSKRNLGGGDWNINVAIDGIIQGTSATQSTVFKDYESADWVIGYLPSTSGGSESVFGWMDEVRVTMGFALYAVDYVLQENKSPTPDFVDPFEFISSFESVAVLGSFNPIHGKAGFADNSIGNLTWTPGGTSTPEPHSPFNGSPDGEGPYWSLRCDGVDSQTETAADGAYLTEMSGATAFRQFDLRAEDFTMEVWCKERVAAEGDGTALLTRYNRASGNRINFYWWITTAYQIVWIWSPTGNISSQKSHTVTLPATSPISDAIALNEWHHHVVERFNDDLYMWLDGLLVGYDVDHFLHVDAPNGNEMQNQIDMPLGIGRLFDHNSTNRSRALDGWITEPRITVSEAVYASQLPFSPMPPPFQGASPAEYSASPEITFTVPTVPFTETERSKFVGRTTTEPDPNSVTDLHFLTHWVGGPGSPDIEPVDESDFARAITLDGGALIDTLTPFPNSVQATGSLRVAGSTVSPTPGATIPDSVDWDMGDADFCFETHVMFATVGSSPEIFATFFGQWEEFSNDRVFRFGWDSVNGLTVNLSDNGSTTGQEDFSVPFAPVAGGSPEQWYHVVACRKGRLVYLFIDGVVYFPEFQRWDGSGTIGAATPVTFGYSQDGSSLPEDAFDGWLAETRITIGHYVYEPEDFTPRTEPFDHHLTVFQPGPDRRVGNFSGIFDYSRLKAPVAASGLPTSTHHTRAFAHFTEPSPNDAINVFYPQTWQATSNGDSVNFDYDAGQALLDSPFTIECWGNISDTNRNNMLGHWEGASDQSWTLWFRTHADGRIRFDYTTDGTAGTLVSISYDWPGSPRILTDFHVAVVRDNTVSPERIRMYIDGVELLVETSPDNSAIDPSVSFHDPTPEGITFGATTDGDSNPWDGRLEDCRVIKKVMYSGNFTPPTSRLPRY